MATIACTLVENGIDAPSSEYEIYNERLRLLTGEYDSHKGIKRQEQKGELLRLCARNLAYSMSEINIRSFSLDKAYIRLREKMPNNYSDALLKQCLNELENPCNVLVKDQLTNEYSFGHFRFQEHLVCCEIKSNRNINLAELSIHDWWQGSLSLYAQENDISHLFEEIYKMYGNLTKSRVNLEAMIKNSQNNLQSMLKELLNRYSETDRFDEKVLGYDSLDTTY